MQPTQSSRLPQCPELHGRPDEDVRPGGYVQSRPCQAPLLWLSPDHQSHAYRAARPRARPRFILAELIYVGAE